MINERALRSLILDAVKPWLRSQLQLVIAALAHVLVSLVLASHPQKIIKEAELAPVLTGQVLEYLAFEIRAIGARDSN